MHPGSRISHDIVLERRLGEGSMGEVWVAQHHGLRRRVAVKFILDEAVQRVPHAATRFLREAVNASRIRSPNVVQTFEYALASDGTPYIAMELLEGESLDERLRRGPLSVEETSVVLCQVGSALDTARTLGIVHRDIKPQNLFLCRDGHELVTKVLDFGNAKSVIEPMGVDVSSPGMLAGSPAYVSRDMLLDPDDLDHRVDLWALGVTAFKCLTGELPFKGRLLIDTVQAIIDGDLRQASSLRPSLGPQCDAWFERVFAEEPALRPQSGQEMADSFAAQMGVRALSEAPSPRVPALPPPARAHSAMRWAMVALATVAATGVALAAYAQ